MICISEGDKVVVSFEPGRVGIVCQIRADLSNLPILTVKYDNGDIVLARICELISHKEMVAFA